MEPTPPTSPKKSGKNKTIIIITLLSIIVIIQGVKIYLDSQDHAVLTEQKAKDRKSVV